jgi:RNA polymerase sigma factor (sigma-70 family)
MQQPPTFKELLDAVTALYEELRVPLLRFAAFKNFGKTAELEDLVHDVFVQFYSLLRDGSTIDKPKPWLYKAVRSRVVDKIRREEVMSTYLKSLSAPQNDSYRGVEQDFERAEMVEQLLSPLNVREREVLMLSNDGCSHEEIAEALDISVKSVSVYKTRGLKKLRAPKP